MKKIGGGFRCTGAQVRASVRALIDEATFVLDGAGMLFAELLKRPDPRAPLEASSAAERGSHRRDRGAGRCQGEIRAPSRAPRSTTCPSRTPALAERDWFGASCVPTAAPRSRREPRTRPSGRWFRRPWPAGRGLELGDGLCRPHRPGSPMREPGSVRLRLTKAHSDALKRSPETIAIMALFNLLRHAPKKPSRFSP